MNAAGWLTCAAATVAIGGGAVAAIQATLVTSSEFEIHKTEALLAYSEVAGAVRQANQTMLTNDQRRLEERVESIEDSLLYLGAIVSPAPHEVQMMRRLQNRKQRILRELESTP